MLLLKPSYQKRSRHKYLRWLKTNPQSEEVDEQGNTLLHLAIIHNDVQSLGRIKKSTKQNKLGYAPLQLARKLNRRLFFPYFGFKITIEIESFPKGKNEPQLIDEEQFKKTYGVEYLNCLEFQDFDILKWAHEKCRKRLQKKCFNQMNAWIKALHDKEVAKERLDHVAIKWINPFIGYGIFAAKNIPALSYIGEYTGIVKKRKKRKDLFNNYVFRYVTGPKDTPFIIDAKERGNFTRFINHSDQPNCTSRWVISGGITHIILFANQFIPEGKQLTYDYGKYYWRSRSYPLKL